MGIKEKRPICTRRFSCCVSISRILFRQPSVWTVRYRAVLAALCIKCSSALHISKDLAVSLHVLPRRFIRDLRHGCRFLSGPASLLAPRALLRVGVTHYRPAHLAVCMCSDFPPFHLNLRFPERAVAQYTKILYHIKIPSASLRI